MIQAFVNIAAYVVLSLGHIVQLLLSITLPLIVTGIPLHYLRRLISALVYRAFGWPGIVFSSAIGTPVHEISHAIPLWITGHRLDKIDLFKPDPRTGRLGGIRFQARSENLLQQIGTLLSAGAPPVGGALALYVLTRFFFPDFSLAPSPGQRPPLFTMEIATQPNTYVEFGRDFLAYQQALLTWLAEKIDWRSWRTYAYLYSAFSIAHNISPSPEDVRAAVRAGGAVILGLTFIAALGLLFGDAAPRILSVTQQPVTQLTTMLYLALATTAVGAVAAAVVALPAWLLRSIK
jgi:hypothetical protein